MRNRGHLLAVAAGIVVLVVLALAATSSLGPLVLEAPSDTVVVPTMEPAHHPSPTPSHEDAPPDIVETVPLVIPDWVMDLLRTLGLVAVVGIAVWGFIRLLQAYRRVELRRARAGADPVEAPTIDEEELAESIDATLEQLHGGIDVEDAVVQCWRRLERLAADAGVERVPTQTSEEFTIAVLATTSADAPALRRLGGLFRQAVYSTHPLDDRDRADALGSLERLRDSLTEGARR